MITFSFIVLGCSSKVLPRGGDMVHVSKYTRHKLKEKAET